VGEIPTKFPNEVWCGRYIKIKGMPSFPRKYQKKSFEITEITLGKNHVRGKSLTFIK